MIINIASLSDDKSLDVNYEQILRLPQCYNLSDHNVKVKVLGTFVKKDKMFNLEANVTIYLVFNCDNCLTDVDRILKFDLKETFSDLELNDEYWYFNGKNVDLDQCLISNICCFMPMKFVCNESCKGLCKNCGKNLNSADCGCDRSSSNYSEFEVLKSLFNSYEEV